MNYSYWRTERLILEAVDRRILQRSNARGPDRFDHHQRRRGGVVSDLHDWLVNEPCCAPRFSRLR